MHELNSLRAKDGVKVSLCTFVTDWNLYSKMVERFKAKGFVSFCEYIYIDNSEENKCSAYSGINKFLNRANGNIVIVLHQDVHPVDDFNAFSDALLEIEKIDPNWAILGNAGYDKNFKSIRHLSSPMGWRQVVGNQRIPVESLDENFLVFNTAVRPSVSYDLDGFHLYGTDAVQIAKLRGLKSYILNYHVDHFGTAKVDESFLKTAKEIENKYSPRSRSHTIRTPVTYLAMGGISFKAWRHRIRLKRFVKSGQKRSSISILRRFAFRGMHRLALRIAGGRITHQNKSFIVPLNAPLSAIKALKRNTYELEERLFVNKYLKSDLPVVELGGAYGVVSSDISARLKGLQAHIILEAIPDLVKIIEKNVGVGIGDNVHVHNAALSYNRDLVEFDVKESVHSSRIADNDVRSSAKRIKVPSITLQKLLEIYDVKDDYCLVCDVEGAEINLLEHEQDVLKRCVIAIIEFHPLVFAEMRRSTLEFFELIEAAGFSIVDRQSSVIVAKRIKG